MQAVVTDMLARQSAGTIVNIISTSEHCGQAYLAPYSAAKAGLAGLTRNAAHAHRFDRICINGLNRCVSTARSAWMRSPSDTSAASS
jgi:NAD(P)-dependent dehydrogenase (short-subunit alcohol dehydrogenase family)